MPTIKQDIDNLNGVDFINKLKSLFTKLEAESAAQAQAIEELSAVPASAPLTEAPIV